MPHLPPPERLLGDILRLDPHTRDGQYRAAHVIEKLVADHGLGMFQMLEYDVNTGNGIEKFPMVKIISEFGHSAGPSRSTMTWLGHLDTVPPGKNQQEAFRIGTRDIGGRPVPVGEGRGTLDMWPGNLAYLYGLERLRDSGSTRHVIQTLLTSREEMSSEVLDQAIENGDIEGSRIGATTEILVGDNGELSQVYRGRTGRFGFDASFHGLEAPHSGAVDRNPAVMDYIAHRIFGRGVDEVLDNQRGFRLENKYPGDEESALPHTSRVVPGRVFGEPDGLSVPGTIEQHWDLFHSDPNLEPAWVLSQLEKYLEQAVLPNIAKGIGTFRFDLSRPMKELRREFRQYCADARKAEKLAKEISKNIKAQDLFTLRLEKRQGGRFTDPWLVPKDDPLTRVSHMYACELAGKNPLDFPTTTGSGVAEEGMLVNRMGMKFTGWSPNGKGAHTDDEYGELGSIPVRAEWLAKLASYTGDLA